MKSPAFFAAKLFRVNKALVPESENFLERFPEFRIEDCVDDRVDAAVDVSEPGGDEECRVARMPVGLYLDADGVDDVAGEEGCPANQETA